MDTGKVFFFNLSKGFGKILNDEDNEEIFVHFSQVIGDAKILFKDEEVEFEVQETQKGKSATNVNHKEERIVGTIEKFEKGYGNIKSHSSDEKYFMHYSDIIGEGYIKVEEGFEVEFTPEISDIGKGLQAKSVMLRDTRSALEKFAYFEHKYKSSNDGYLKQPAWFFKTFERESYRLMYFFKSKPELANYFQKASDLIYDVERRLIPDYDHILDDREKRFPELFRLMSKPQQVEKIKSAIDSALIRIRRNYKTAIPQYYDGNIQLLLPLCLDDIEYADVALVVAKEGGVYRANTVLPLDWAYI